MKIEEEKNYNIDLNDSLDNWSKYAKAYDPIKCASIDGTDTEPHDRAVIRALNSTYKPNRFVKGRPECTIFVSRLSHETSKETIKELFSKYGKLKRFRMVKDIVTGMPKGYAFVEYEEEQAAEEAYRIANKMVVDGNIIFVDFECERLLKGWRPRRLGGGFAGKKESGQLRFGGRDRPFKKPIALELREKEDKKLNEKKKRREEEQRHRRHRRRSPGSENGRNSPVRDKTRRGSPSRDKAKRSLSTEDKEKNRSPPRKAARRGSLSKESGRHQSPTRENSKQLSLHKDQVKPRSPSRENNIANSSRENIKQSTSQKNINRHSSPTERAKQTSPSQKIGRKHSPARENGEHRTRENIKYLSPPRKNFKSYLHREENVGRYSAPQGEIIKPKHHSPVRDQTIERHSPIQKQFRSTIRENDRRHSPANRNDQTYSSRGNEYFFPRERGYRSPVREGTSPRRNERHFSPSRGNDRHYLSPIEGIRYRSPVRENRRPISPKMETNRRNSPIRESTKHYSPSKEYQQFSTSREIRHQSPPSENLRNFPVSHENTNYPPSYYSEPQGSRHFLPVRGNTRPFSPFRDVRHPTHSREVDFPPPRDNVGYFSPPRKNERQYFHTRENANHYSSGGDFESNDNFSYEQNTAFPPAQGGTQFSQLRSNRGWRSNPSNRAGRFPRQRGNYRGAFRRY